MTIAGSIAPRQCTHCVPPAIPPLVSAPAPAPAPAPAASGGGPTELSAAIEQLRLAVEELGKAVAKLSASMPAVGGAAGAPRLITAPTESTAAPVTTAPPVSAAAPTPTPVLRPDDAELARRIDDKVLAGTGLAGKGSAIVAASRKYRVPVDFALAIYQKEASFAKSGTLADRNNNPGNLRFSKWQKEHGGVPNGGFTKYPTMNDGIDASMHLLSLDTYRDAVARRDWGAIISKYAPSFENDTALYVRQMSDYTAKFRDKLGIDTDWLQS